MNHSDQLFIMIKTNKLHHVRLPIKKLIFYDISTHLLQKPFEYFTLFSGSLPANDKRVYKLWYLQPSDYW